MPGESPGLTDQNVRARRRTRRDIVEFMSLAIGAVVFIAWASLFPWAMAVPVQWLGIAAWLIACPLVMFVTAFLLIRLQRLVLPPPARASQSEDYPFETDDPGRA